MYFAAAITIAIHHSEVGWHFPWGVAHFMGVALSMGGGTFHGGGGTFLGRGFNFGPYLVDGRQRGVASIEGVKHRSHQA